MYFNILNDLIYNYKLWIKDTEMVILGIKSSIYQNNSRDILLEKVMSYGIGVVAGHIVFGLVGLVTGGMFFTAISAVGGVMLSKLAFRQVFGKTRNFEELLPSEKSVILKIEEVEFFLQKEKIKSIKKSSTIYFGNYTEKKKMLEVLLDLAQHMDKSKLSWKYKNTFNTKILKLKEKINKFNEIYCE